MDNIKNFNDYLYEGFDINKLQFLYKKVLNSLGVKLYYASKYETAMISLLPVIDNLINAQGFIFEKTSKNIILLTIYSISILTHESTDKLNKIHETIKNIPITDLEVQYLVNALNNLRYIFSTIAKDRNVSDFHHMLQETDMLLPFLRVINNMILKDRLNIDMFTGKFDGIKIHLGEKGYDLLIHNILNKMVVIVGADNKVQNKEVLKPFYVNDEFKSPMYKSNPINFNKDM